MICCSSAFLNPDRISLPDIDVDFDDAGRQQVLEWVTENAEPTKCRTRNLRQYGRQNGY